MIVTLSGSNDLLRHRELTQLVATFEAEYGDMAIERFDGDETTADRMRESLQSTPFLSARKLVILREPGKQKAFTEHIAVIVEDIAETTDLIIYEPKLDKRISYYKTLKKATDFREYGDLDAQQLSQWAVAYATDQEATLRPADARFLIDRIGTNQQLLRNELDKLISYNSVISRDTIELLTERLPQSTIFELLDAAFSGNEQRAFSLYQEQRSLKVEPQAIIALIAWQLHILTVIKAADTRSVDQIAKEARLNPFVIRKSQGLVRHTTLQQLKQWIADLLGLDMQLKRTAIDADEALQLYLLKLANR